jgi:hypothetical protein
MEVDNLAAVPQPLSGEVVPNKPPSPSSGAQPPSEAEAIQDDDARVDIVDEKGKEKVEEKKKEPVFFKGVELVDLDDCDVPDMKLHYDNDDTDDDDSPNPEDMDVGDGGASSSQCLEPNLGPIPEPVQSAVPVHNGHPFEAAPSVLDPLFNAAGKAPHPDAVIVKQEAGWFQLCEEKRQRKAAEKLALQQEKDRIAKEREDSRRTIAYLQELLHKKLGGDIDVLLAGNPGVPITEPSLSMPAPSLQGVPFVAFPVARGAIGSQSSPFVSEESLFPPLMPEKFSYPRVEDNSSVSPVQSISPMQTDPPNLPPLPPADRTSPIVGRALGFDTISDAQGIQPCAYPRVEDTCIVEHRPHTDAAMEDAPLGSGMAESEDATEIECAFRNASIGGCKDALLAVRSSDDDEDEGGGEDQVDARMSDDLSFGRVGSAGASYRSDSNPAECSGQGHEEQHAEMEGDKAVDLLADNVDPYEDAMHNDSDGRFHAFLLSKSQSINPNIPHSEVCIHLSCLFNFKSVLYFLVNTFCLPRLSVLVVFFIWIVSMTSIVSVNKMW